MVQAYTRSNSTRKRVEEPTDAPINVPTTRSDRVWFDDGNVVLQAEQTLFKVLKSIIAFHSTVLKDMFSIPQPHSEGEIMVEGCPVIRLSDTAMDVTIVLEALFQRGHATCVHLEPLSAEVVVAFLRLGDKYNIEILHSEAIKRLFKEYPTSLSDYLTFDPWSLILPDLRTDIVIINLARDQGLLSVLPLALFSCCLSMHDPGFLPLSVQMADSTEAKLSPDDIILCFTAYQTLVQLQLQLARAWFTAPAETYWPCTSRVSCTDVRTQVMREALLPTKAQLGGLDDFQGHSDARPADKLCSACQAIAQNIHNEGRFKFWNALPGVFGLPDWEELKKERD